MKTIKQQTSFSICDYTDLLGMLGIGLYCFLVSLFYSNFAEIHIQLSFLNFPIFISEMLLLGLFVFLLMKIGLTQRVEAYHRWWGGYLGWVFFMVIVGYCQWGPITLRNAALFYYVAFAFLGFSFYNPKVLFHQFVFPLILIILVMGLSFQWVIDYYWYTCLVLIIVILLKRYSRYCWWGIPLVLLLSNLRFMFTGSRAHLIAVIISFIFIFSIIFLRMMAWRLSYRLWATVGIGVALIIGIKSFADLNSIRSLTEPSKLTELYRESKARIEAKRSQYMPKQITPKLYNDNIQDNLQRKLLEEEQGRKLQVQVLSQINQPDVSAVVYSDKNITDLSSAQVTQSPQENNVKEQVEVNEVKKGFVQEVEITKSDEQQKLQTDFPYVAEIVYPNKEIADLSLAKEERKVEIRVTQKTHVQETKQAQERDKYRNLDVAYANMLFRWFIWEDMCDDLVTGGWKSILGVGLGRPQRSKSLEILEWGESEWGRDGWITPHNSFFHMIYRAGVIGLLVIVGLIYTVVYVTRIFIRRKDISGILLLSVVIYWACLSMFSVTLELPYNAILFWSLLGMTTAYALGKKEI